VCAYACASSSGADVWILYETERLKFFSEPTVGTWFVDAEG
jgi:hypothetical protein